MTARESLNLLLSRLPDDRIGELLEHARLLADDADSAAWRGFGQTQFARAYGNDEPEYSMTD